MDLIDLHTHSTCSDGTFTPRRLVHLAKETGLRAVALTDHDTVAGVQEALEAGENIGLEVVAGVEISAEHSPGIMHILGYYLSPTNPELLDVLKRLQEARAARYPRIIERLQALDLEITETEVTSLSEGQVGRSHIARALVNRGHASSLSEAFARYLKKGGPAYVEKSRLPAQEVIALIRRAGGLTVLAHPFSLGIDQPGELISLVRRLRATGLEGIEVFSPHHTEEMTAFYREIASRHGLLCTGGSDFHGDLSNGGHLGGTEKGLKLPYALLQGLKERLREGRESAVRECQW